MKLNIKPNLHTGGKYVTFEKDGNYYYADRSWTLDWGMETMIFPCNEDGEVSDWSELYCDHSGKSLEECVEEFVKSLEK